MAWMDNKDFKESYGLDTETDIDIAKIIDKMKNKDSILKGLNNKLKLFKDNKNSYRERWIFCSIEKLASLISDDEYNYNKLIQINKIVNQLLILYSIDTQYCLKNCVYLTDKICGKLLNIAISYFENIYYERYNQSDYNKKKERKSNNIMMNILKNIQLKNIILNEETEKIISKLYDMYNLKRKDLVKKLKDWEYRKDLFNNKLS